MIKSKKIFKNIKLKWNFQHHVNYIVSHSVSPGGVDSKTGEVRVQGVKCCEYLKFINIYILIVLGLMAPWTLKDHLVKKDVNIQRNHKTLLTIRLSTKAKKWRKNPCNSGNKMKSRKDNSEQCTKVDVVFFSIAVDVVILCYFSKVWPIHSS